MDRFLKGLGPDHLPLAMAMPLVRSVYPQQIAQHLVSVQPMPGPTGDIWFAPAGVTRGGLTRMEPRIEVHEPPPPKEPIKHIRKLRIPSDSDA